jgi:hypothetical protein
VRWPMGGNPHLVADLVDLVDLFLGLAGETFCWNVVF